MAKKSNPHPHVAWREGRPRFTPGKALREKGYAGTDLRWPAEPAAGFQPASLKPGDRNDGRWFTRGEAVDWSIAFCRRLADGAPKGTRRKTAVPAKPVHYTLERLFDDWFLSPKFTVGGARAYRASTITDYKSKSRVIKRLDPELFTSPVAALDPAIGGRAIMRGFFERCWQELGLATAKGTILVTSSAISWAILRGKVKLSDNPATQLQMETPEPRVRFLTRKEMASLVAAADLLRRYEIGDMVYLGVWTGQRQADRLALLDNGLLNKRRYFRQGKTNAIVAIREAPELEARLAAAKERRKTAGIVNPHVILDEAHWTPFRKRHYITVFSEVREAAVKGIRAADGSWALEPCPSLADFWEMDLRDTAVTWMALAGATIPEIIAVTGHTPESATRILRHYLARHPEMADSAIGKMVSWYEGGGETELGL